MSPCLELDPDDPAEICISSDQFSLLRALVEENEDLVNATDDVSLFHVLESSRMTPLVCRMAGRLYTAPPHLLKTLMISSPTSLNIRLKLIARIPADGRLSTVQVRNIQ